MANPAEGEDEFEAVDQRLSESQNFPYTKTLRDTVVFGTPGMSHQNTNTKQAAKGKRLRGTVTKTNLSPGYLKRQFHAARTSLAREIKKQSDDKSSLPTEKELSSHHLCLHTTDQS